MKKIMLTVVACVAMASAQATDVNVTSPDGKLVVSVACDNGQAAYCVSYDGKQLLTRSLLGLETNIGDFTRGLTLGDTRTTTIDRTYKMARTKASTVLYVANQADIELTNADGYPMTVTFCVSNNDVAFRYSLPRGKNDNPKCVVVKREATSFNFPQQTTTFLCPQSKTMVGWERTKPSYEEEYKADAPMTARSAFGEGFTLPCLYRVGTDGWVLVGETGVGSNYVGSHLSDYSESSGYTIAFPTPRS